MSDQEFCRYCGNDTRGEHRDDCPAPDIERVEARLAVLEEEGQQLRRIALAAGRVSDAAIVRADLVGNSTALMLALGDLDHELGKPLRRHPASLTQPSNGGEGG